MCNATPRNRRAAAGVRLAILLLLLANAACGTGGPPPGEDAAQWAVVQEYLDRQAAWEAEAGDIGTVLFRGGEGAPDELLRRAEEAHGELPDATAAVAAAREIVAAGGLHTVEAAEFLIERSEGPFAVLGFERRMEDLMAEFGPADAVARLQTAEDPTWEALIAHVGPDWAVVQSHLDERNAWLASRRAAAPEESGPLGPGMDGRPSAVRAVAAALAMLDAPGAQEKAVEAVEFLVENAMGVPRRERHLLAAVRALAARAPDYEDWPRVLAALDMAGGSGGMGAAPESTVDGLLAEMASDAGNAVLQAASRYYLAARLMRGANSSTLSPDERAARRASALEAATGLSAGVADAAFDDPRRRTADGAAIPRTFAQAEAELLARIRHATVGGTLPEWTGRRLDGAEEPLSSYRGRVLLIDFWATWCRPCIYALPDLRRLVADLPADRFALLAISVDAELATVTEFMQNEPMPWDNWHVGVGSEIERLLDVRGFPTYLLVDEDGVILANGNPSLPALRCMAERAVAGEDPACSPADWFDAW